MYNPYLEIDDTVRSIRDDLTYLEKVIKKCGNPNEWEDLRELLDMCEDIGDILRLPESIRDAILDAEEDLEFRAD